MRVHVPLYLRWADLDAYGHVNNSVMLRLLEEARIRLMWLPAGGHPADKTRIFDAEAGADSLTVVAQQHIEYKNVLPYLETPLDINVWVGRLGGSSVDIYYEVYGTPETPEQSVLYARAMSTLVVIDAATQKPRRLRENERDALQSLREEPIAIGRSR
ncbi:thioesterase family protein [Lysinibacter sp. HNR]|uniref:acyl-CoA thioesterase n=1 Tax=Lysinibacter sp. HNR TaxID=3031408 RepID=UPI00243518D8|nr:thioesterase family protein [Lysinibacter sp. HNR]WGD36439.1 thioesterase family protein [Lysinibacter sp. HNR]